MKQYTIKLTPTEPTLKGKYPSGVLVLVVCNADKAGFTINLPDCGSVVDTKFKLIREDENRDNDVTVIPWGTQKINNETNQNLRVGHVIDLVTDRKNWW
jgi:hypothetical protein